MSLKIIHISLTLLVANFLALHWCQIWACANMVFIQTKQMLDLKNIHKPLKIPLYTIIPVIPTLNPIWVILKTSGLGWRAVHTCKPNNVKKLKMFCIDWLYFPHNQLTFVCPFRSMFGVFKIHLWLSLNLLADATRLWAIKKKKWIVVINSAM